MAKHKKIHTIVIPHQYPVVVEYKDGRYVIEYGAEQRSCYDYTDACHKVGEYVMHAMACAGIGPDASETPASEFR